MRINRVHFKLEPCKLLPTGYLPMDVPCVPTALGYAKRKGYELMLVEDFSKYPINLMGGYFTCCGAMCPKQELQQRIDAMQSAIDRANYYFTQKDVPEPFLGRLKEDLSSLSAR